jgi:hypothetical protein
MDMELSTACGYPSLAFRLAVLGTFLFIPFGIWLSRRSAYPSVVALVPILGNLAAAFFGLGRAAYGMTMYGGGRRALAAGCAEALLPLEFGAAATLIIAGVAAVWPGRHSAGSIAERRLLGIVMMVVALFSAVGILTANWLATIASARPFSASLHNLLLGVACALLVACLLTLIAVCRRGTPAGPQRTSRREALVVFAAAGLLVAVVHVVSRDLQQIAFGPPRDAYALPVRPATMATSSGRIGRLATCVWKPATTARTRSWARV